MKTAQGKRGTSAALGYGAPTTPPLFGFGPAKRSQTQTREINHGAACPQGGGLGGLALGYYRAAPAGAPGVAVLSTRSLMRA